MITRIGFIVAVGLCTALPAFAELVVHTKDGRSIRVPVEPADVASIEFLSGSATPIPSPVVAGSIRQALVGGTLLSGEAWADSGGRWPFQLKVTAYNSSSGDITGEITWPSLSSVHRVHGSLHGATLSFVETEAIRRGGAHLNVSYTFTLSESSATGTWLDQGDKSRGGAKFSAPR